MAVHAVRCNVQEFRLGYLLFRGRGDLRAWLAERRIGLALGGGISQTNAGCGGTRKIFGSLNTDLYTGEFSPSLRTVEYRDF